MDISAYDRRFTEDSHKWEEVVSPVARRVIKTAWRMIPMGTTWGPALDDPLNCPFEIHQYQLWLFARLRASGLAKGLAGGEALLPDITAHLAQPWRYLARLVPPRTYEQLTRQLARNLEWYLDQSRPPEDIWTQTQRKLPITALLTGLLLAALGAGTGLFQLHWLAIIGLFILITLALFGLVTLFGRNTHKHQTNCAELFFYLLEEYAEPDLPTPKQCKRPVYRQGVLQDGGPWRMCGVPTLPPGRSACIRRPGP
jgi:hypothetical protein